ncbi:hypothetical protein ACQKO6_08850 [Pseudomonas monteilii]
MQRYAVEPTDCNTDPIAIGPERLAFQTHYMILIQENSISASMGIATVLLTAVWVESAAIGLLLIYAVWAKPWKLKGPEYDTFIKHGYAAGLTVMGAVLFVASVVR